MVTSNTNMAEVSLKKFKRVKNGLDEAEVFSAINALIGQNRNLTERIAHLDSLTQLAERTVIQAEQEAEDIKKKAELAANSKADSIISNAEQQAKSEADKITAEAHKRADEAAQVMLESAQRQADEIMIRAESEAKRNAEEIVKAAEVKAQQQTREMLSQSRKMLEVTVVDKFRRFVEDLISDTTEIERQSSD
jgi:vacuolar-type H+-ATPase subunit H